ncbi:heavy metal-associated isoprenylated plant protein 7-like isoform X1 [Tripterygium wilfordii]|uniref:heavy metal-associated isoprenylated plant protein 7-like isoform X1 n=1 Tax=Tripterygium wilfordii TaxID=458696 RepID=UPI0018F81748|nr:heavy metal-associated isoprenylated plant protein 7-like isoform X1 [Tripterygium wilfordii]
MGVEENKPAAAATEEKKMEEKKPEEPKKADEEKKEKKETEKEPKPEKPAEEKKEEKKAEESKDQKSPPPPQEIVLNVYMHCEGCARKVRRSLKGFEGVENVTTDCKTHKVVVKGEKADPLKVLERVERKSHRKVELLSPIPKPPTEEEKKAKEEEKPKTEEKKEEPQVITVVLKVFMHCEACALEIKKRIQRMKGVESAEPDLKSSQVTVKGVFDPEKLVEYVYKRTGKHASIVKTEPAAKKEEKKAEESKDEKKADEGEKEKEKEKKEEGGEESKDKKEGGGDGEAKAEEATAEETKVVEVKGNPYYYYPPRYAMELYAYPQIFSDENPNACSVM